jgi:hypothetical protein
MTYTPYLIANYGTALYNRLQPWLIPDDAQEQLFDGFVYRGTMSKREGYNYFAIGEKNGSVYRESRIISTLTMVSLDGTIDGTNKTFTKSAMPQIARGSVVVTGSSPSQVFTDDGLGHFVLPAINITAITNANPAQVTTAVNHGYTSGNQVLISGVLGMIRVNSSVPYTITVTGLNTFTLNGFDSVLDPAYISGGTSIKIIGSVNYISGTISITFPMAPAMSSTVTMTYSFMPGNPMMMITNFITADNIKQLIVADTQYINKYDPTLNILVDITTTPYTGNKFQFFTSVNYESANNTPRLLFCNNKDVIQMYDGSTVADYTYTLSGVSTLSASFMVNMKDRLILLRTTENGTIFPKRIRISGTGANSDVFDSSATGAGFIDIPDGTWINGATFNRDDLLIFTEASTWVLKYTGNDTTPFVLDKIDESRGSSATFSAITYLNRSSAASPRGLIISDGYRVERQDETIPNFSFNEVDGENFELCFAGTVDSDRDHYLIYPPSGQDTSSRILTTNYDEDNYSIYRLPLSCMGTYITAFTITWNDLLIYPNWASFAAAYGDWNSFSFNAGAPFSLGGGQHGELWRLGVTESEDNPVNIYNITVIDDTHISVTTDFNNYSLNEEDPEKGADYIFLTGIIGMEEVNNQQFPVEDITNANTFILDVSTAIIPATSYTPYISGGRAQRVIPFSALFKKFNPFIEQDKKVRCGWLYMYVDSSGTDLQRNIAITSITNSNPCIVTTQINHNLETGDQVSFFLIGGMTQLNGLEVFITVITPTSFSLGGIDSTTYGVYTSGGYSSTSEPAKMSIDIITNDVNHPTQLNNLSKDPYQGNITNIKFEDGAKKWYKVFINQTGRFIQFRLRNQQAGAKINIQATMPGFQPVGRLI